MIPQLQAVSSPFQLKYHSSIASASCCRFGPSGINYNLYRLQQKDIFYDFCVHVLAVQRNGEPKVGKVGGPLCGKDTREEFWDSLTREEIHTAEVADIMRSAMLCEPFWVSITANS